MLKNIADHTSVKMRGEQGKKLDEDIRRVAAEIRETVYDYETMKRDDSGEPEEAPEAQPLGGLGANARSPDSSGKYEGFGNSVRVAENLGDKVIGLLDSVTNPDSERDRVLEVCSRSDTGDYQPVHVPSLDPEKRDQDFGVEGRKSAVANAQKPRRSKKHVPGRAGGGWDSEEEEEISGQDQLKALEALAVESKRPKSKSNSTSSVNEAVEADE